MSPLEPPETHYLLGAVGWIELGNCAEAELELGRISAARQQHPNVLEVRWMLYNEQKKWAEALQAARWLIHAAPERASGWLHQAYALRRVPDGGLKQAWDALLPVFEKFPRESLVPYNLACYACQMGDLEAARTWFQRSLNLSDKQRLKAQALADSDLEPLWEEIRKI
jgi:tetratricopeptide (TPR) repeat protein